MSGETAYEKARDLALEAGRSDLALEAGRSLDQAMRTALEGASKFNAAVEVPMGGVFSWITYADLEDALNDYSIAPDVFRAFVEDEGDGMYDPGAAVKW